MSFDRRTLALALTGAAILPAAAMAQQAAPRANTPPQNMSGVAPDQLAMRTHEAGTFSLMTARVGVEKATNADVKRFAQFEVQEQEGVAQAMRLAGHNFPEPRFEGEKAQILQRLRGAGSGNEFDMMFLQVQEQGHQELLNLTTAIMQGNAPAPDKIMATLANGQIKEHLILIGLMRGQR
ncbi:DUF4142 domain-containing protein [Muricoccus radiodurans]|uniref:DUF4142 domain-containing protein n=1 Tax=Muricoccus radiodurans TaxID=2231721 RepID=UPI003CF7442A